MRTARVLSLLLLPLFLPLSGCANGLAARQADLARFVGQSETTLVQELGVPTRSFESGGHRFLAYVEQRTDVLPGVPYLNPWAPWGGPWGYDFGPSRVVTSACETTFDIVGGTVRGFSLRGNACG
ncbi:MAG: hypothetical protein KGJ41_00535 [Rhodospirillales bacterium]|nr:hypothetical protein [Rhodospirillales bacterium]MDE2197477.1 hypothetical protein [Rhodospirillales bacterium]MDE2576428.1 hypothetical protein [Rhodospirillales bacterium]